MNPLMRSLILTKIKTTGCITARNLVMHLLSCNISWTSTEIKSVIVELSNNKEVVEIEIIYPDHSNESIFFPLGTVIREGKYND